jgi:hypothetical protein
MPRRLLTVLMLAASLAVVACSQTPAAPTLNDPKEILVQSVASLQTIKTVQVKGTFGGTISAPDMGPIDLSTVKLDAAVDMAGKKLRLGLDAPSFLGTQLEVRSIDQVTYLKIVGPLAAMFGADTSGKFIQFPAGSGMIPEDATDPVKALAELRAGLDKLPAPVKLADERCGDQDCYHVRISLTQAELGALSEGAAGTLALDVWSRRNDLRPAKVGFAFDGGTQGTVTGTFEMTYDQTIDISAPPADQIAPAG